MNVVNINIKPPILSITKLKEDKKNQLLQQVPSNYKNEYMVGIIHDYYLCIDRTYNVSLSYMHIDFVSKDKPLFIFQRLD